VKGSERGRRDYLLGTPRNLYLGNSKRRCLASIWTFNGKGVETIRRKAGGEKRRQEQEWTKREIV